MGRKKHVVDLSEEERSELGRFISMGEHRAEDITRARILLKADEGLTDPQGLAEVFDARSRPLRPYSSGAVRWPILNVKRLRQLLAICEHLGCSISTPYRTRKAYSERGLAAVERRKPDRDYEPKLDGRGEAHLVALACSEPPEGRSRWTYQLLADRLVTLEEIDLESISRETVRQRLKKRPETASLEILADSTETER